MSKASTVPHNDYFYAIMSRKERALAFFERYLPDNIKEVIDLSDLTLCESKHISDKGKTLYNDVLYKCSAIKGQTAYLYAMCEHQSNLEAHMPLRILEYNTAIIRAHIKGEAKTYPLFANFVVYHGKELWKYSTRLGDYYENKALGEKGLYMAPFTLINLPEKKDEEIYQDEKLGFCFAAFRCTKEPDAYKAFEQAMKSPMFNKHFDKLPTDLKSLTISYVSRFIDEKRHSLKDFVTLSVTNTKQQKDIMTSIMGRLEQTIAQKYINLGEKRGKAEGLQLGEQRGVQRGLQLGKAEGIQLGKQRGIQLGEQRGEQRGMKLLAEKLVKKGLISKAAAQQMLKEKSTPNK
jgi:predicted transposase/invertase (TIGR01784 family)